MEHDIKIAEACRRIEQAEESISLADLAAGAGLSSGHFQRLFKSVVGLSPKQYEKACREKRVRAALSSGEDVTTAFYDAGFQSSARFYEEARQIVGMQPRKRSAGGLGECIQFAVGDCSLGVVLVAATEKGICTISLGDDAQELVHALEQEFSAAELKAGDADFQVHVANVIGLIEGNRTKADALPLDIRGTAFQKKVWQALTSIPSGQTVDYSEVARRIGLPKSVRAVANACGSNRLAVAIPCHRVVRKDGSLSGYRWGVERKQVLLDREQSR